MKFSEAIRLGAMSKPQAFGVLIGGGDDVTIYGDVFGVRRTGVITCAIGAALDAVGALYKPWASLLDQVGSLFPVATVGASCPTCGGFDVTPTLPGVVMHLNDDHRWSREQIADWVETIEGSQESDAEEAHHDVAETIV